MRLTCHCLAQGEGESRAEVPKGEEGQTGQAAVALPGPAHSSVSIVPKPL